MRDAREIARAAFDEIRTRFPTLRSRVVEDPEHVDLEVEFPAQPDLLFDVDLNLQNGNELHMNASLLWASWFPCSDPEVTRAFVEAVTGLIAGEFRILEHRRGSRTVRAELQRPDAGHRGWETVTGTRYFSLPWPRKRVEIVQNPRLAARSVDD